MTDDEGLFGHDGRYKPPLPQMLTARQMSYNQRKETAHHRNRAHHAITLKYFIDMFDGIDALGSYLFYAGRYRIITIDYGIIGLDFFSENILLEPQGKYRSKIEQRLRSEGVKFNIIGVHRFINILGNDKSLQ